MKLLGLWIFTDRQFLHRLNEATQDGIRIGARYMQEKCDQIQSLLAEKQGLTDQIDAMTDTRKG